MADSNATAVTAATAEAAAKKKAEEVMRRLAAARESIKKMASSKSSSGGGMAFPARFVRPKVNTPRVVPNKKKKPMGPSYTLFCDAGNFKDVGYGNMHYRAAPDGSYVFMPLITESYKNAAGADATNGGADEEQVVQHSWSRVTHRLITHLVRHTGYINLFTKENTNVLEPRTLIYVIGASAMLVMKPLFEGKHQQQPDGDSCEHKVQVLLAGANTAVSTTLQIGLQEEDFARYKSTRWARVATHLIPLDTIEDYLSGVMDDDMRISLEMEHPGLGYSHANTNDRRQLEPSLSCESFQIVQTQQYPYQMHYDSMAWDAQAEQHVQEKIPNYSDEMEILMKTRTTEPHGYHSPHAYDIFKVPLWSREAEDAIGVRCSSGTECNSYFAGCVTLEKVQDKEPFICNAPKEADKKCCSLRYDTTCTWWDKGLIFDEALKANRITTLTIGYRAFEDQLTPLLGGLSARMVEPDDRACAAAVSRGIDLAGQAATARASLLALWTDCAPHLVKYMPPGASIYFTIDWEDTEKKHLDKNHVEFTARAVHLDIDFRTFLLTSGLPVSAEWVRAHLGVESTSADSLANVRTDPTRQPGPVTFLLREEDSYTKSSKFVGTLAHGCQYRMLSGTHFDTDTLKLLTPEVGDCIMAAIVQDNSTVSPLPAQLPAGLSVDKINGIASAGSNIKGRFGIWAVRTDIVPSAARAQFLDDIHRHGGVYDEFHYPLPIVGDTLPARQKHVCAATTAKIKPASAPPTSGAPMVIVAAPPIAPPPPPPLIPPPPLLPAAQESKKRDAPPIVQVVMPPTKMAHK